MFPPAPPRWLARTREEPKPDHPGCGNPLPTSPGPIGVPPQVALPPHGQPFQHGDRCRIPRVAAGSDPVLAPGEQVAHQQAHRLSGIAAALIPGSDREAYFTLAGVVGARHGRTVADQLAGRAQHHGELEPFP